MLDAKSLSVLIHALIPDEHRVEIAFQTLDDDLHGDLLLQGRRRQGLNRVLDWFIGRMSFQ